ncbi:MAG: precorrin-4 C(11)-methyltransferase [Deltaproteobacteria bacterium]|nr:precorrin-4 C(11)-methyltransferase [Deltaproteobacteria bacterium]
MIKKNGIVSFIGAGPGEPELITVKGKRLLQEADVVVYAGSLVNEKVLQYAKKDAAIYNSASMNLEEIMKVMVDAAKAGKKVARLHTGDPILYSALQEQADILEREKIPYEIVSGVSSAFASAAALKTELTMPEITQTVIFTRLEGRTSVPAKERLSELARHNATMCIFLSIGMMEKVVEELKHGYTEDTPIAVVYRATWEDEKIVRGTLCDIAEKVTRAGIERQAMIIVGRTLGQGPAPAGSKQGSRVKGQKSKLYDKDFEHGYRKSDV